MTEFLFGPAGDTKTDFILGRIGKVFETTEKKIFILVPEQMVLSTEMLVAKRFGGSSALRIEVISFTLLSDEISRKIGGISSEKLTSSAEILIMWKALVSSWPRLSELGKVSSERIPSLVFSVYETVKELTECGVSAGDIKEAADTKGTDSDDPLMNRLRDLCEVMKSYENLLINDYNSIADPYDYLAKGIEKSLFFENTSVFVCSFDSMSASQIKVIGEIIKQNPDLTVSFPMKDSKDESLHMADSSEFFRNICSEAVRYSDGSVVFTSASESSRGKSRELSSVQDFLWDFSYPGEDTGCPAVSDAPDSVKVYRVRDRYDEAESVCAAINSLVRKGCRYSDISVICASLGKIKGILDSAMKEHGIPYFISESTDINSSPAVRLIYSLLKIPGRWDADDIVSLVKSGLLPLSAEECDFFVNYTRLWNIRSRSGFTNTWNMSPDGYGEKISARGKYTLASANGAREKVIPLIDAFCDTFGKGKAPVSDVCRAIMKFFEKADVYSSLISLSLSVSDEEQTKEYSIFREICRTMDVMVSVLGDTEIDASAFSSLFFSALSEVRIGAIPPSTDQVSLSSAESLRNNSVKHVIIVGASEGEFPASGGKDLLFSSYEKERLQDLGLRLGKTDREYNCSEMYKFWKALSAASESLTVFVPLSVGNESVGVRRINALLGRAEDNIPYYSSLPLRERIFDSLSLKNASYDEREAERIKNEIFGREILPSEPEIYDAGGTYLSEKYKNGISLSSSALDRYKNCPFRYFSENILGLEDESEIHFAAPDIGSFVHKVLEKFFVFIREKNLPVSSGDITAFINDASEEYFASLPKDSPDARVTYTIDKAKAMLSSFIKTLSEEMMQSAFENAGTEIMIGSDGENASSLSFPLKDGTSVSLRGIIDRLDCFSKDGQTYVRIIDYKTGKTKFSMDDVKKGLNMQLLIYLFSACANPPSSLKEKAGEGRYLPGSAMYYVFDTENIGTVHLMSAEDAEEKLDSAIFRRGLIVNNEDVIRAIDKEFDGIYSGLKLKNDGTTKSGSNVLLGEADFEELKKSLAASVTDTAMKIKEGKMPAKPRNADKDCKHCSFSGFCRYRPGNPDGEEEENDE